MLKGKKNTNNRIINTFCIIFLIIFGLRYMWGVLPLTDYAGEYTAAASDKGNYYTLTLKARGKVTVRDKDGEELDLSGTMRKNLSFFAKKRDNESMTAMKCTLYLSGLINDEFDALTTDDESGIYAEIEDADKSGSSVVTITLRNRDTGNAVIFKGNDE